MASSCKLVRLAAMLMTSRRVIANFVSFGDHSVCRHESATGEDDTLEGVHFERAYDINSLSECQQACAEFSATCYGIEYLSHDHRCEIWTTPISHVDIRLHSGAGQFVCQNHTSAFPDPVQGRETQFRSADLSHMFWTAAALVAASAVVVFILTIIILVARRKSLRSNEGGSPPADDLTLVKLKEALEGAREQQHTAPDVFLTVLSVGVLQRGLRIADLSTFHLRGLRCRAMLEAKGTVAQLAGMVTADAAARVLAAAGAGEATAAKALGLNGLGLGDRAAATVAETQEYLAEQAQGGSETKSVEFEFIVNLEKTLGEEAVVAKAQVIKSSTEAVNQVMSVSLIQMYIEDVFSRKATTFVANWWRENVPKHGSAEVIV